MSQIAYARKEIAFAKWKASGYADKAARAEYERWFKVCQQSLANSRIDPLVIQEGKAKWPY